MAAPAAVAAAEAEEGAPGLPDLLRREAHWVDRSTIVWRVELREGAVVRLHWAPEGGLAAKREGVMGGESADLLLAPLELPRGGVFRLPEELRRRLPDVLKCRLAVSLTGPDGRLLDAAGLQIPGVLDDLFATDAPLGVRWEGGVPWLALWAPTARSVALLLFDGPRDVAPRLRLPLREEAGVWSARGEPDWKGKYYLYEVDVLAPAAGIVERSLVTDPYSRSLSRNGERSQILDLDDPALAPVGWRSLAKPAPTADGDISLYELHVRDFSAGDPSVPPELRGTYLAFALDSHGTRRLRALAEAGLTHVVLQPVFDFGSVDEDRSAWADSGDLSAARDGYSWGYDPVHFGAPEGSYATDADGAARVVELRTMVQALSVLGLRVIVDVAYDRSRAGGEGPRSVLDRIVPGYYHRLSPEGAVEASGGCWSTAPEHAMMERLLVDDLVHWARDYKVDGFCFDRIGLLGRDNLERARRELLALAPEKDGVDGEGVFLCGRNAREAGGGIATFHEGMYDAVRGGSPSGDRREQGFATGLFTAPNGHNRKDAAEREALLDQTDRIRIGLAGNLADYRSTERRGREAWGRDYGARAAEPRETIQYVSAHDGETLWDKIAFAAPARTPTDERVRMHALATSLVLLAQGVPFYYGGTDLLRSKSLDGDSAESGDRLNRIDWTLASNGFGLGPPPAPAGADRWDLMRRILSRPENLPKPAALARAAAWFTEWLAIRRSSPLFHLASARDVRQKVRFLNTGPDQRPGLIVMDILDPGEGLDPSVEEIVVAFNASPDDARLRDERWSRASFRLHPVQANGVDRRVQGARLTGGELLVPGRTTAVFVRE